MNRRQLAKEILNLVGGPNNVISLVHCATRLRFKLKESNQANKTKLEQTDSILSVVESGGQFQVVIGTHVTEIYQEIMQLINEYGKTVEHDENSSKNKNSIVSRIFEIISGSFSPLIPALAGSGMVKALLTIFTLLGWMSEESGTYLLLSAASNAVFYFLPIFLGVTISMELKANPYVGGVIAAALFEPNYTDLLEELDRTDFLGIPVILADYSTSVFPVFIAIGIYALLDRLLKQIIYKDVQVFLVPMLSLMVMVPLTVILFGPFGTYIGGAISTGILWLIDASGLISGVILGGLQPFLVILGLHWGITPITLNNLATSDGDPIEALFACAVFALIGIAFGIFLRSKQNNKLRALAGSTALTGLMAGITEPILYGLILRYKRTIPILIVAGATGGAINGTAGVKMTSYIFHNIFSIAAYSPMMTHVVSISTSFIIGTILILIFGFESKSKRVIHETSHSEYTDIVSLSSIGDKQQIRISSPLTGYLKPLHEVDDTVFSSEAMGKGLAIYPTGEEVLAPVNGTVSAIFPTKHAIGLTSDDGVEILIHIGINTVQLDGEFFETSLTTGDKVKQGDKLVTFDTKQIKKAGYDVTTPIIITNSEKFTFINKTKQNSVQGKDFLFSLTNR